MLSINLFGIVIVFVITSIATGDPTIPTLPTVPPIPTIPSNLGVNNLTDPNNIDKLKGLANNETLNDIKETLSKVDGKDIIDLEGEVFCPMRVVNATSGKHVATSCGFNTLGYKFYCCGDKNMECCWKVEIWVYVVSGLLLLFMIGGTVLSIVCCCCCCAAKAI